MTLTPTDLSNLDVLQKLTVTMFGKVFILSPAQDLELHPSTLGENLQEQASRYAFYASVRDMAAAKVDALALQVKQTEAALDQEFRADGELPSGGKITEAGLASAIRNHADYQNVQEDLAEAKHDLDTLNSIVRAFEHRRDCLMAMSSRANNTTFHDSDVNVTVSARVKTIEEMAALKAKAKAKGAHPSK